MKPLFTETPNGGLRSISWDYASDGGSSVMFLLQPAQGQERQGGPSKAFWTVKANQAGHAEPLQDASEQGGLWEILGRWEAMEGGGSPLYMEGPDDLRYEVSEAEPVGGAFIDPGNLSGYNIELQRRTEPSPGNHVWMPFSRFGPRSKDSVFAYLSDVLPLPQRAPSVEIEF